jgi:general secretion pathway protein G
MFTTGKPMQILNKQKADKGFTLIELLIVMVLLGFLITAGVSSYTSSMKKSRDTKRKNDLRQIATALETYNNDTGTYPLSSADGKIIGCATVPPAACEWGTPMRDSKDTIYMVQLPAESSSSQRYYYSSPDGTYFQIYARLENTEDADIPKTAGRPRAFSDMNCSMSGTAYCDYGVASTNRAVETGRTIIYE